MEKINDPSLKIWASYGILAEIAEAQGDAGEATRWRRKEQDSYAAYAGSRHAIRQYEPLIQGVVEACQGSEKARQWVEDLFPKMEAGSEEWARNAAAIRRILDGERDIEVLRSGLKYMGYMIVRTILARLNGSVLSGTEGEEPSPPNPLSRPAGEGEPESSPPKPPFRSAGEGEPDRRAEAEVAKMRQQFSALIGDIVAASQGDAEATERLDALLEGLAQQDGMRNLATALRNVLDGQRDPAVLLANLEGDHALLVGLALSALGVDVGLPEEHEDAMTLDDILGHIANACRPDAPEGLSAQLHTVTHGMATQAGAPAEINGLGRVLNDILSGERDPDLSSLSPVLAVKVRQMLASL